MEQETGPPEPQPVDNCSLKWCWILLRSWADTTVTARLARSARSVIIVSTSLVHQRCFYTKSGRCPRLSKFLWRGAKHVQCEGERLELLVGAQMCLHSSLKGRISACVDPPRSGVVLVTTAIERL